MNIFIWIIYFYFIVGLSSSSTSLDKWLQLLRWKDSIQTTPIPLLGLEVFQERRRNVLQNDKTPTTTTTTTTTESSRDIGSDMTSWIPVALSSARDALKTTLYKEAYVARLQTVLRRGKFDQKRHRPFKMVQQFLNAKPLSRQLSMVSFILQNATESLISRLPLQRRTSLKLLSTLSSPLLKHQLPVLPGSQIPQPHPMLCPWTSYSCRLDKYRSIDGSCNNLQNPIRGRAFIPFKRYLHPDYGDGLQSLRLTADGSALPSARLISLRINEDRNLPHHSHTLMLLQWGQFLDHDLSHTAITKLATKSSGYGSTENIECGDDGCSTENPDCAPISVPYGDPDFRNKQCLEFVRSEDVPNENCTMGSRQQLNQVTSFIDASTVYGSTEEEAKALRQQGSGLLRLSSHPKSHKKKALLPTTTSDRECNEINDSDYPCFKAGDNRVNEQTLLMAMHTIWAREHNYIANRLLDINPHWGSETIYQESRRIVGALVQHITFNEFIPAIIGIAQAKQHNLLPLKQGYFTGYNKSTDPSIANVFATAAFRFGHSLIDPFLNRADSTYKMKNSKPLKLRNAFFDPEPLYDLSYGGMDGILRGACLQKIQNMDRFVSKEVTAHLFDSDKDVGTDLVSLNIQRGRDHGIPGYNQWREWCGMKKAFDFMDFKEIDAWRKFREVYRSVDDVDLFPAAISERPVTGGIVGPTFTCILARQFQDLKAGDRYWYENDGPFSFTLDQLDEIRKVSLASILCRNGDNISHIQPHAMYLPFVESFPQTNSRSSSLPDEWFTRLYMAEYNKRVPCHILSAMDLSKWKDTTQLANSRDQSTDDKQSNILHWSTIQTLRKREQTTLASLVDNVKDKYGRARELIGQKVFQRGLYGKKGEDSSDYSDLNEGINEEKRKDLIDNIDQTEGLKYRKGKDPNDDINSVEELNEKKAQDPNDNIDQTEGLKDGKGMDPNNNIDPNERFNERKGKVPNDDMDPIEGFNEWKGKDPNDNIDIVRSPMGSKRTDFNYDIDPTEGLNDRKGKDLNDIIYPIEGPVDIIDKPDWIIVQGIEGNEEVELRETYENLMVYQGEKGTKNKKQVKNSTIYRNHSKSLKHDITKHDTDIMHYADVIYKVKLTSNHDKNSQSSSITKGTASNQSNSTTKGARSKQLSSTTKISENGIHISSSTVRSIITQSSSTAKRPAMTQASSIAKRSTSTGPSKQYNKSTDPSTRRTSTTDIIR